jgi:hypothetical protein
MEKGKFMGFALLLLSSALVLTTCGGGSGGGGGSTGGGSITYTGITAQATIDSTNSENLAGGAYKGGALGSAASLGAIQKEVVDRPTYLDLALTIEEAILHIDVHAPLGVVEAGAIITESDTIAGDCGGTAQYAIQYNDATGDFSGNLSFASYCSSGVTLTGGASFSGKVDLKTRNFLEFTLSLNNITSTSGNDSFTVIGSITYIFQVPSTTVTMDILLRDNGTGKVCWVNNFSLILSVVSNYVDFQVFGRYYHPDYGYVSISTPLSFRVYSGSKWPSQGILILDGKTGIAGGSTRARLTVISSTNYRVEADTNGDGTYDWSSAVLTWH